MESSGTALTPGLVSFPHFGRSPPRLSFVALFSPLFTELLAGHPILGGLLRLGLFFYSPAV